MGLIIRPGVCLTSSCRCINKNLPVVSTFQRPVGALIDAAETEADTHTLYHKVPAALIPFTHTIGVNHLLRECLNAPLNVISVIDFFFLLWWLVHFCSLHIENILPFSAGQP